MREYQFPISISWIRGLSKYKSQRRIERAVSVGKAILERRIEDLEKDKIKHPDATGVYYSSQRYDEGYIQGLKCMIEFLETDPDKD